MQHAAIRQLQSWKAGDPILKFTTTDKPLWCLTCTSCHADTVYKELNITYVSQTRPPFHIGKGEGVGEMKIIMNLLTLSVVFPCVEEYIFMEERLLANRVTEGDVQKPQPEKSLML